MKLLAFGRLIRLSLAPTALADILAGVVLGAGGRWPSGALPYGLLAATIGVYHGAMALNDWADRAEDAGTRPDRPIPSGAIPAPLALAIGLGLVLGGVAAAASLHVWLGVWMGVVGALAVLYDLVGRGPWRGPLLLGLCRAGNLGAGLVAPVLLDGADLHPLRLAPAVLYGAYVFVVSRLGRLEDGQGGEDLGARPARFLRTAALLLALVGFLPAVPAEAGAPWVAFAPLKDHWGRFAAIAVGLVAAAGLAKRASAIDEWTPGAVGASMGMALRRLLPFTAACALLGSASGSIAPPVVAALILCGFPLSHALRKVFPPS